MFSFFKYQKTKSHISNFYELIQSQPKYFKYFSNISFVGFHELYIKLKVELHISYSNKKKCIMIITSIYTL